MSNFKVGDRVKFNMEHDNPNTSAIGTVIAIVTVVEIVCGDKSQPIYSRLYEHVEKINE